MIAHLPSGSDVTSSFRRGVRRAWAWKVGLAGAAVVVLATVVGEWIVAHPLATACAFGPYVLLLAFGWWASSLAVEDAFEATPIELADEPGQPEGLAERVARVIARAGGRQPRVFLTRRGSWAALLGGRRILLRRELVCSLSDAELEAVLHHELAHRPQGHLKSGWAFVSIPSVVVLALGAGLLVWPSMPPALAATVGLLGPVVLTGALWHPARLSRSKQRAELHADLCAARATDARTMIGALLQINELDHLVLREQIAELTERGAANPRSRERLEALRAQRDDPTVIRWQEFDANGDGVLELDELGVMLRWMREWPLVRLEATPRTGLIRAHPPVHERILFLLREDPAMRRRVEAG